jgi:hypothetical protein
MEGKPMAFAVMLGNVAQLFRDEAAAYAYAQGMGGLRVLRLKRRA